MNFLELRHERFFSTSRNNGWTTYEFKKSNGMQPARQPCKENEPLFSLGFVRNMFVTDAVQLQEQTFKITQIIRYMKLPITLFLNMTKKWFNFKNE